MNLSIHRWIGHLVVRVQVDGEGKKAAFSTQAESVTSAPLVVYIDKGSARCV